MLFHYQGTHSADAGKQDRASPAPNSIIPPASMVEPDEKAKTLVNELARRWLYLTAR